MRTGNGKLMVSACVLGLTAWTAWAGPVAAGGSEMAVRYTATCTPEQLQFGTLQGYDTIHVEDALSFDAPGQPMLPALTVRIALPAGMRVTGLRVLSTQSQDLPGQYMLYPAQPPRRLSDVGPEDFVAPDAAAYASTAAYPAEQAEFLHESDLAGQAIAEVRVHPVQYVAAEQMLTLYTAIEVELEGVAGYVCGDYLPARISEESRTELESLARSMVVNPADVVLEEDATPPPQKLGVAAGDYDYVIITQSSWVTNFQALADWKTKKGKPATIVTTTWIYANYSGSSNPAKIRAFVVDAYSTWGATFFLLGGDSNIVPAPTKTYTVDTTPIPNDTYYADFDDDYVCEVHVGRAAARTTTHISTLTNKWLNYEKNPPATNYAKTAFFFGFDLSAGSGEGEGMMQAIDDLYLPSDWTYRKVYDSDTGNHKTNSTSFLNQGNNLVNHSDHSDTTVMGCGYVNHNYTYANADMTALTNGTRQSFFYSLGCWACDYANSSTCIAEAFVQNANGGGYAFVGNSRYGWYSPGATDGVSAHYDRYFFRSMFNQGYMRLGTAFSNHKNTGYSSDEYMQYIFTELTLLGDPELFFLSENPQSLTVTHPSTLAVGVANSFPVHVAVGSTPLQYAPVCVWKGAEIYKYQTTDASGNTTFTVTPTTAGTMYVTATSRNYFPYEGTATASATTYTLTVNVSGSGSVDLNPPGGVYGSGVNVQLQANGASGWHFDHWSGALSGSTNPTSLLMDGNKTVTATFVQDQVYYTLTVNPQGPGHVDLNPPGGPYSSGTTVQLSAVADGDARFDHWTGALSGSTNPSSLLMNSNKTVTAVFWLRADMNCDGAVNNQDIDPFVKALFDLAGYSAQYPNCNWLNGDMTGDSQLNNQDIDGFVAVLFQ